jgi:hypothetical protein
MVARSDVFIAVAMSCIVHQTRYELLAVRLETESLIWDITLCSPVKRLSGGT